MAALRSLDGPKRKAAGAYTISGKGVNTASITLGAALSKALTIASRLQRQGLEPGEDLRSITIRRIGSNELLARVDVRADLIQTVVLT